MTRVWESGARAESLKRPIGTLMSTTLSWTTICASAEFQGNWVALDNCRYDAATQQPIEGEVVDCDEELGELCARMRNSGHSSCAILFCGEQRPSSVRMPAPPRVAMG